MTILEALRDFTRRIAGTGTLSDNDTTVLVDAIDELAALRTQRDDANAEAERLQAQLAACAAPRCGLCRDCVSLSNTIAVDELGRRFCEYLDRRVDDDDGFGCTAQVPREPPKDPTS